MTGTILVVNAGSSSIKFRLYRIGDAGALALVAKGLIEAIGGAPKFRADDGTGQSLVQMSWDADKAMDHERLFVVLADWIDETFGTGDLIAVGHRVVHGGVDFAAPVLIDDDVVRRLVVLEPLAPLHQKHNLAPIRALKAARPGLPQIACFDTAFHRTWPAVASTFALPRALTDEGIRRYGFHGLSYAYIARAMPTAAPAISGKRIIVAHLGNGASLCAIKAGRAVDSTMGFTALDGVPMGTRSGSIDPGVLLHLMRVKGMDADALEDLLYNRSGLLGVSGISNDMRALLASPDPRAREAIDLYVFRIAREIGALAASMGGLDGLVFTAGIGEHAAPIRARICAACEWLGVRLDAAANEAHGPAIGAPDSAIPVYVIPTDEEIMIARHVMEVIGRA